MYSLKARYHDNSRRIVRSVILFIDIIMSRTLNAIISTCICLFKIEFTISVRNKAYIIYSISSNGDVISRFIDLQPVAVFFV